MSIPDAISIVDAHCQKYEKSCSPSIIEILLKLEKKVGSDYYEQQDFYQNQNVGLTFVDKKEIAGMKFHKHNIESDGTFITKIQNEINAGRFVGVYVLNDKTETGYHGWVALGIDNGKLILRSKRSELKNNEGCETVECSLEISKAIPPKMTDLIFYQK